MQEIQGVESQHAGIVPGTCVRLSDEPARLCVPGQNVANGPIVELIREGDIVQAIDVTCSCGHRIRLRCMYAH